MQLHRTEYERNFTVLWLFLATVACHLSCLSVRPLHTHSEHWQNSQNFFLSLSLEQTQKHSMPSTSGFCHNCREADCLQATPTLLTIPQYVCVRLLYQPFLLNTVSPFSLPHTADELHKHKKLIIFCSLCLKYPVWTVRDIPRFETEILPKMYNALPVQCR